MKNKTKVIELYPTKKGSFSTIPPKDKKSVSTAVVVASAEQQAKPLFTRLKKILSNKIKTPNDFDLAGQKAKLLKGIKAVAEEERDGMVKPIREGVKKAIEKIDAHFKPFFDKVDKIDTEIKLQMSIYLEESKKKKKELDAKFENSNMKISTYAKKTGELSVASTKGGAQVRKVWEARLVDKKKVPSKYLVPDMKSVEYDLRQGIKVPGFVWEQVEKIAI
jgi:hypothetical protein